MALMRLCSCERATKPEKVIQANRDAGLETCPELFCPKKQRDYNGGYNAGDNDCRLLGSY